MIEVKNVVEHYKKKKVLQDISFQAKQGECVAIVGRNGCGKSTLLQIMAGVLKADSGEIRYYGQKAQGKAFRKFCGYVPQENPLMEELTVLDNLKLWGAVKSGETEAIIKQFHLADILKMPVAKLSGGMKRRLAIACACFNWPPVLLLDEPTTALDLYYKENIHEFLAQYRKLNGIILMTTHDEEEIQNADRCLIMTEGRMKELSKDQINMQEIYQYIKAN